jgi:hypothetical protein
VCSQSYPLFQNKFPSLFLGEKLHSFWEWAIPWMST